MITEIPAPVIFNPLKHHSGFQKKQLQQWKKMEWKDITPDILSIGNNLLDFYFGKLTVNAICKECLAFLVKNEVMEKEAFFTWLKPQEFRKIELSDHSLWIMKKGSDKSRFVHIHPAKQSLYTLRVRATTLKTVLALQIHSVPVQKEMKKNLKMVNNIRVNYLKLSPIKSLHPNQGILHFWKMYNML